MKHRLSGFLFLSAILAIGASCSNNHIELGTWKTQRASHEYVLLTDKEGKVLGEPLYAYSHELFPATNERCWRMVKEIGKAPLAIKPTLVPYSIAVVESGFTFLEATRHEGKSGAYEDIEWGWRILVENRNKEGLILAYAGYALIDKDGYVLESAGADFDNGESGTLIEAGKRTVLQGRSVWRVNLASKPYPPSRVRTGDYKLFLRRDFFWENLTSETATSK